MIYITLYTHVSSLTVAERVTRIKDEKMKTVAEAISLSKYRQSL